MYKKMWCKISLIIVMISMITNLFPVNILFAKENDISDPEVLIYDKEGATSDSEISVYDDKNKEDKKDNKLEDKKDNKQENEDKEIETSNSKREIKGEIINKRTQNTKEFLNTDNTTTTAIYPFAVHYMKDGKWEDIDNSLVEKSDTDGEKIKENKSNNFKIKFANKATDKKLITIKSDKLDMKWSLQGSNEVKRDELPEMYSKKETSDRTILNNIGTTVSYKNILKDVDIKYDVESDNVKENIILKNTNAIENKYIFNLDIGKLNAKLNEDKSISVLNEKNEIISKIESPFMYDSKLEFSDDIEVKLEKSKNSYTVELVPSTEWLKSKDRSYPVTIDPTVNTSLTYSDIKDTYIYSGDSDNATRYRAHIVRAGGGISKIFRSLIKFTLPTLNSGDQVVDAQLNLCNYPETQEWTPWTGPLQINVHKVTSDWQQENAYWSNTSNIYDSRIVDYIKYQYDNNDTMKRNSWNITSIVKDWYVTGNNYGLMLKENNEAVTGHNEAYFLSADTTAAYYLNYRPVVIITYRNQSGLEDYWSFHEQNIGRAGTSYVNDYNGNIVLVNPDVTTPGSRMPASVYHVYNSNDKSVNIGFGKGYRLNISQTVELTNISGMEYAKYIDEDGTRHYFLKQSGTSKYIDEDGLGLTLTLNSDGTFTMTDKAANKMNFVKKTVSGSDLWHLKEIIDVNNNKITISFLDGYPNNFYISKVTDSAGSEIKFNWSSGRVDSIIDSNNRTINYTYDSNSNLTTITYPDSKTSTYTYNSNSYITSAKSIDNMHVDYEYYATSPYRIKSIKEYSSANELGNTLSLSYGENTTTFTDNKNDSNIYNFNYFGNTTSVSDFGNVTNGYTGAYGKAFKYGTGGGEKNKLTLESKLSKIVENEVKNTNMEADRDWTYWYWGVNNGSISYVTTQKYIGSRALKVVAAGANASSRSYGYQWAKLQKGKTYTLSAYVKTEGITNNNGGGARPFIYYNDVNGVRQNVDGELVRGTTDWKRYMCTFTYPSDATSDVVVSLGITGENGTAYFDGVQVEEGEVVNTYNLIQNGDFDDGTINYWEKNSASNSNDTVIDSNGSKLFRFTGEYNKEKNIKQSVKIDGKSGDILNLSGWVKNLGAPNQGTGKGCRMTVYITGTAGQGEWLDFEASSDSSAWQYSSNEFKTKFDYSLIDVYLIFYNDVNEAYFDNISLLKDDFGQSYSYDKDGNLVSTQDMAKQNSTMQYSGKNELLKETNPKGGNYTYEYSSQYRNRLLSATNNSKVKYSFEYDGYGNPTSTKIENTDKVSSQIVSDKVYYIRSKSSGLYFDVFGGNITTNGTVVKQYQMRGNDNQKWKIVDVGGGYYTLKPYYAQGMALDLDVATRNCLQIYTINTNDAQKFKFIKNIDGSYRIICKKNESDKVLTVLNDSKGWEENIGEEKYENKDNQSFYLEEVGIDYSEDKSILESGEVFYLKAQNSGLYLDYMKDSNGNLIDANDTKVVQRGFTGNSSQKWKIVRKENGTYKLISMYSLTGRALTLYASLNQNESPAILYEYNDWDTNQEWSIVKNTDGTYSVSSKTTGYTKYLTVKWFSSDPELDIFMYQYTGGENQKFYLEPANEVNIEDGATYKIKNKNSGLYAGAVGNSNGANVEQVASSNALSLQWQFVDLKNGYYKIITKNGTSDMGLDVGGAGTSNGTNIQLWQYGSVSQQQWEIIPIGDGSYTLKPRHTGGKMVFDVSRRFNSSRCKYSTMGGKWNTCSTILLRKSKWPN